MTGRKTNKPTSRWLLPAIVLTATAGSLLLTSVGHGQESIEKAPTWHTISGPVTLANWLPYPGVVIRWAGSDPRGVPWIGETRTGEDGRYSIPVPHGWTGRVWPVPPDLLDARPEGAVVTVEGP